MIVGRLDDYARYADLHPDLKVGLESIANLNSSAEMGEYELNERVALIVSSYETIADRPDRFEAHVKNIDIQYAVFGQEKVEWSPLAGMEQSEPYDASRDRAYWIGPSQRVPVIIGNRVYAIIFPEDAHRPCLPGKAEAEEILKATVKIKDWR